MIITIYNFVCKNPGFTLTFCYHFVCLNLADAIIAYSVVVLFFSFIIP